MAGSRCSNLTLRRTPLPPRPRTCLACLVSLALLAGCQTWRVAGPTPTEYLSKHSPDQILVLRADSSRLILLDPSLEGDTLRGFAQTGGRPALPLSEVRSVSVRGTSWGKTLGLVGAVGAGVAVALLLGDCGSDPYC
jgi:hypothetical protein